MVKLVWNTPVLDKLREMRRKDSIKGQINKAKESASPDNGSDPLLFRDVEQVNDTTVRETTCELEENDDGVLEKKNCTTKTIITEPSDETISSPDTPVERQPAEND